MKLMSERSEVFQNELRLSVDNLTTSFRYFFDNYFEAFDATGIETQLYPFTTFSSSVLAIEQNLLKEFITPGVNRTLLQAKVYLEKHAPIVLHGILWWEVLQPSLSRNSDLEVEKMTSFRYGHSGLWKQGFDIPSQLKEQRRQRGCKRDVLAVVGFGRLEH
jgi:hypothetical protein